MTNRRILVSYVRRDAAEFSRALSERLAKEHGFTVWRDLFVAGPSGGHAHRLRLTEGARL
jgi:hypothetical protein